jgi:hypothetical protein
MPSLGQTAAAPNGRLEPVRDADRVMPRARSTTDQHTRPRAQKTLNVAPAPCALGSLPILRQDFEQRNQDCCSVLTPRNRQSRRVRGNGFVQASGVYHGSGPDGSGGQGRYPDFVADRCARHAGAPGRSRRGRRCSRRSVRPPLGAAILVDKWARRCSSRRLTVGCMCALLGSSQNSEPRPRQRTTPGYFENLLSNRARALIFLRALERDTSFG